MTPGRVLLISLYWLGVALVLVGVVMRFVFGVTQTAFALAVFGAALLIAARVNSALRPHPAQRPRDTRNAGGGLKLQ